MINYNIFSLGFSVLTIASGLAHGQASFVNKGSTGFAKVDQICDQKTLVSYVQMDSDKGQPVYISWNKPNLTGGALLGPDNSSVGCGAGSCDYSFVTGPYEYFVKSMNVVDDVATLRRGWVKIIKNGVQVYSANCKTPDRAVVQCITKDRVIYVTKNSTSNYSYYAYSNSGSDETPALTLLNGTGEVGDPSGMAQYKFKKGIYGYEITTASEGASSGGFARILVTKNGSTILNQKCDAYSLGIGAL